MLWRALAGFAVVFAALLLAVHAAYAPLVFSAEFVNATVRNEFAMLPSIAVVNVTGPGSNSTAVNSTSDVSTALAATSALPGLVFSFADGDVSAQENELLALSAAALLAQYGMVSLVVLPPTTEAPATMAPEAPGALPPASTPYTIVLTFDGAHRFVVAPTVAGGSALRLPWFLNAPQEPDILVTLGEVLLGNASAGQQRFTFVRDVTATRSPFFPSYIPAFTLKAFLLVSDVADPAANGTAAVVTAREVYRQMLDIGVSADLCAALDGCIAAGAELGELRLRTAGDVTRRGHDKYIQQKNGFLIAVILIGVFFAAGFVYCWRYTRSSEVNTGPPQPY